MECLSRAKQLLQKKNSVLFVTSQLRQREIKMAYALKSMGWRVGLIYYNFTPFKPDLYFDFAIEINSAKTAYQKAKLLNPKLIHVFSGAIDDYILNFCKKKLAPTIIDLNDLFVPSLMRYCPERYTPTKKALKLADGFCARDLQVKCANKLDHYKIPSNLLFYPEYCWNNFITQTKKFADDEIHIVSVGTISLETYQMFDCCYLELVKKIIAHGIHFHIYPPWIYRKNYNQHNTFERDYKYFLALASNNPYLHIHESLPVDELYSILPQYDFGIVSGGYVEFGQRYTHFHANYVASCFSGRIADYLDAGLPVLINEEVTFNFRLLKHYRAGINLKLVLKPHFKEMLQALKKDERLKQNIKKASEKLSIQQNAKRLINYYEIVSKPKPKNIWLKKIENIFLPLLQRPL